MDFVANFSLNKNDLEANFELNQPVQFDALFEINPAGASWGGITGTLANQTDLQNALNLKADKTELDADVELLNQTITETYNTLDSKIDDVNSDLSGDISTLDTNIQNEATTRAENDSLLQGDINTLNTNLANEINNRATADSGLQTQINSVKQTADSAIQPNDNITLLNNNAGFITNAVNDLTNYYKKTETYTKTEVNNLIASIPQFTVRIVQTLPQTGERMVLYLVPKDSEAPDVYNEYIWIENTETFELIGSTAVDLDGYATEEWVQNQGYATETYVDNGLATKQNVLTAGENITISGDTISATDTDTTYTAGTDIEIVNTPSASATVSGTDSIALNNAVANSLQSVTVSGVTELRNLPNGYTQLSYIEDSDDTYIDLGMHLKTAIHSVELKVSTEGLTNNNFFGARNSTTAQAYTLGVYYNKWRVGWGTSSQTFGSADTDVHTLKVNCTDGTFYVDNVLTATLGAVTTETPKNACLGGVNAQTGGMYTGNGKFYYLKLWQNDTLIKHLVPAKRNTDDAIGVYDIVNDRFFTNSGTGDFVAGSNITTPSPYFPMDIVSNNGVLKVSGNLLNRNDLEGGYLLTDEGQKGSSNNNWILTNFIKVKPNTSYIFDFISGGDSVYRRVCGYSAEDYNSFTELLVKKQRPVTEGERFSEPFTTSATTNYIKVSTYSVDTNVQITEGVEVIPYRAYGEVYANGTTETITDSLSNSATAEILLSTGNNTDTQEILTGAITRNTAIKVLKGTESWYVNTGDYNFYRLNSAVDYSGNLNSGFYCTHFKTVAVASTTNNQGIRLNGNSIFLRWDELYPATSENLPLFRQWLANQYQSGTPVVLVYPITTAETETVTGQTLNVQSGDNTLTATGALTNLPISATYTAKEINTINFTNDTGYITGINSTDVTTALGYTPVNPSSLATVATSGSYNDLSNKPTIPSEVTESTVSGWGFTKNEGTVTSVNNTQPDANGNVTLNVTSIPPIAYGTSSTAAATVQKVVSIPEITELNVGQIIVVQPTITSTVANSTLKLNDFDAYPMRYSNAAITTSTDATVWSLNYPSQFVFDGTYWVFLGHGTDTNTTYTINYSIDAGAYKAGVGNYAITRYSLCMQKPDMTWEKVTATSATYSTGTSKSVNTNGFILGNIRYYNTTAIVANGANTASNTMNEKAATLDFRYSSNCGATPAFSTGDYIYFVGTIGADGLFYLDTTQWWTNTLPSTNDGKLYVQLGKFLADYNISLYENHPAYYYNGTKLCEYKVADNKQNTLVSGTNIKTINNTSLLGSGNIDTQDIISIEYGSTTYQEVLSAYNNGKYLILYNSSDDLYVPFTSTDGSTFYFVSPMLIADNKVIVYSIDSSGTWDYIEQEYADTVELSTNYQSKLVSGTNIKTINSTSLLGSGDIAVQSVISDLATIRSGASAGATAVQPSDLATVATSGSYNDLSNKPTIPSAQVNSDWNASSGVAQILNKPNLATVATSGSYNDLSNKPTIPSEVTESTVSGWGFTKNEGTVTSVNNTQPINGNVTISIPDTSNLANKDLSNLSSTGEAKFQAPLVSGTNIKTINSISLLGSGNIDIQGGGGTTTHYYIPALSSNSSEYGTAYLSGNRDADEPYQFTTKSVGSTMNNPLVFSFVFSTTNRPSAGTVLKFDLSSINESWSEDSYGITGCTIIASYTDNTSETIFNDGDCIPFTGAGGGYQAVNGTCNAVTKEVAGISLTTIANTGYPRKFHDGGLFRLYSDVPIYYTRSETDDLLADKQDTLVSGTNIKTINSTSLLGSGNIDTSEIFIAEYGVTSFADIQTAYNAGKVVFCNDNNHLYALQRFAPISSATFTTIDTTSSYLISCNYSTNDWHTNPTVTLERTSNKVTSISSSSTDTQYPSAKCVYDELTDKADTDLSNLSSTGQKVIDGQWVHSQSDLGTSTAKASYTVDLSSYLPNDSYQYEVMLNLRVYSSNSSNAGVVFVYSDIFGKTSSVNSLYGQGAAGGYSRQVANTFTIPVGTGRTLYYEVANYAVTDLHLSAWGYRRIGTNS